MTFRVGYKNKMNVLSNNEIYILLKFVSNKDLMNSTTSMCKFDSSFSKKEFEHLKNEMSISEKVSTDEIFQIKETKIKSRGINCSKCCNIRVFKPDLILNYATKYANAFAMGMLTGIKATQNFSNLIKEFYLLTRNEPNFNNILAKDLKYMPVILFAYINKLIDFESRFNDSEENEFLSDSINSYTFKLTSGEMTSESRGTFVISDTSSLSDVMITLGIGNFQEEVDANMLIEAIQNIKAKRLSNSSNSSINNEDELLNKLQSYFNKGLSNTEINILRACKYLMDNDDKAVTNKRISQFLTDNNFPISVEGIKQSTRAIKNKSVYLIETGRGGVPVLVQTLIIKGCMIPPLNPTSKV